MKIEVDPLARVEGEGGIEVEMEGNQVRDVKFNLFEGPRFFESFIKGMHYEKVPDVMRRICAICTCSHSMASVKAVEDALGVKVSRQTELLRDLLIHGEMVESHALHVFALALPDFLGFPSVVHMAQKYPKEVKGALQLKKAGNLVHNLLAGREVHGMNERVGGFATVPSEEDLKRIKQAMEMTREFALLSVKLFSSFQLPDAPKSENTFIAVDPGKRFGYFGLRHVASDGTSWDVHDYRKYIQETTVKHSRAKHSSYKGKPFMVGALARLKLFGDRLEGEAKELFREHQSKLDYSNSISNNLAQAIELVHSVDRCISDVEELLSLGLRREKPVEVKPRAGTGTASVEAPRGTLIHSYRFDAKGRVVWADVITPTAMNAANVDKDFRVAAPRLVGNQKELERVLEIIARAYDPCISCATHLVRVKWL